MGIGRTIAAAVTAGMMLAGAALAQERVSIAGSRASMILPDGFEQSTEFGRFDEKASGAFVIVKEFPPVLSGLAPMLHDPARYAEAFSTIGFRWVRRVERVAVGDVDLLFTEGVGDRPGFASTTLWGVLSDAGLYLAFGQPQGVFTKSVLDRQTVLDTLATLKIPPQLSFAEQAASLGISLRSELPFEFEAVFAGRIIMLSSVEDRLIDPFSPGIFLLSTSDEQRSADELIAALLTPGDEFTVKNTKETAFAGQDGVRTELWATEGGRAFSAVQYVAKVGGEVVIMYATGEESRMSPDVVAAIDRIAMTIRTLPAQNDE